MTQEALEQGIKFRSKSVGKIILPSPNVVSSCFLAKAFDSSTRCRPLALRSLTLEMKEKGVKLAGTKEKEKEKVLGRSQRIWLEKYQPALSLVLI